MSTTTRLSLVTALSALVAAALGSSAAAAAHSVLALPPHQWSVGHVNALLVLLLGSAGTVGALWHALSGLLALISLGSGFRRRGGGAAARLLSRWGAPYVRRVAAGALATALVLPATAIAQDLPLPPDDLGWVPTVSATAEPGHSVAPTAVPPEVPAAEIVPDEAAAGASVPEAAPGTGAPPATPAAAPAEAIQDTAQEAAPDTSALATAPSTPAPGAAPHTGRATGTVPGTAATYVVQDGDSLWTITSSFLQRVTPDAVAAAWPELYRANDGVIGQDPDLIHPGTVLTLPAPLTDRA
ncbi:MULTISPECIES: LysM peptidoglycan-binding domain-containing protein [Actinomyces]|uniref:LysM peptidoglycan-binding domain-containing protein n=1 Tax=Actinomyces respiraculi TaxID=2744574 RepID=A0A7T0LLA1_9ACTO|nr:MULTISPECIES: LysM domain-containing protein [Actinomyces]QPL05854.1 LysM peptidoglycan-binding domain-containing protein [Actinomyces respiraculi]